MTVCYIIVGNHRGALCLSVLSPLVATDFGFLPKKQNRTELDSIVCGANIDFELINLVTFLCVYCSDNNAPASGDKNDRHTDYVHDVL